MGSHLRRLLKTYSDLLGCVALALAMPLLMLVDLPLLRIPFGLIMVLFIPGYVFAATIFARSAAMDGPTLVAVSCMLSVTLLPILGLLLDVLPGGINAWSIALALSSWTIGFALLATLRRSLLPTDARLTAPALNPFLMLGSLGRPQRIVTLLALVLVGALLVGTVLIVRQPDPTMSTTEFYVLGAEGSAESYPREARSGQQMQVTVGIANHEPTTQQYRIEIRSAQQRLAEHGPIELASGQRREAPLSYSLSTIAPDQKIDLQLYRQPDPEPYRRLVLWVDIVP